MTSRTRILVTGANGSIGTRLRRKLLECDLDAFFLTRTDRGIREEPNFVIGDIRNFDAMETIVSDLLPDVIVHLAAVKSVSTAIDERNLFQTNVVAVRALAEISNRHSVTKFIFSSSAAIYGDQYSMPAKESMLSKPLSPYGQSKLQAEQELREIAESSETLAVVSLRIFNVFGPGMIDSLPNRLVSATDSEPASLAGLDSFVRDYIHVDDVAQGIVKALTARQESSFQALNIGTGIATSNRRLVELLSPVNFVVGEPVSSFSCADPNLAVELLGFQARSRINRASVIGEM